MELITRAAVVNRVTEQVETLKGFEQIHEKLVEYKSDMKLFKNKFAGYHYELLTSIRKSNPIIIAVKQLIQADALKKHSYIDRNVLAKSIGNKLSPKTFIQEGKQVRANNSSKLSLGLNILKFISKLNFCYAQSFVSTEGHTIVKIVSKIPLATGVKEAAARVRTGRGTVEAQPNHTPETSHCMLNSSGFNIVTNQSTEVCEALNIEQRTAFQLRINVPAVAEYKMNDKWYGDDGRFMTNEWDKFVADIRYHGQDPIHFGYKLDDRNRMYTSATYITNQGDSVQKAMLQFHNKRIVTPDALKWFKIALANEIYTDKCTFVEALDWFNSKTDAELLALSVNSSSPFAQVAIHEYFDAVAGKPVGTILPFDATNQGAQIYALMGADAVGAVLGNLINTGKRKDAYGDLAAKLNEILKIETFNRSNVKKAFMTYLYGSGKKKIMLELEDTKNGVTKGILVFFPVGTEVDSAWELFEEGMSTLFPSAVALMKVIYLFTPDDSPFTEFIMPDGAMVYTTNTKHQNGDTNVNVKGHYLNMDEDTTPEGSVKVKEAVTNVHSRALAPNIVHAIDSYIMREVIRRLNTDISPIHDSYGVHANDVAELLQTYREVCAEVMEMDILGLILEQINPSMYQRVLRKGQLTKGDLTSADILNSQFALR